MQNIIRIGFLIRAVLVLARETFSGLLLPADDDCSGTK
jgi:hypothetical protein